MVAGSTMEYDTALASAWIRGRQAVITAADNYTAISMIQGDAEVQAGPLDVPHSVKNGQQIIIRPGKTGEKNLVEVKDIPDGDAAQARIWLDERVLTADAARKLVYFEVQARKGDGGISLFDGADGASSSPDSGGDIAAVPVVPANPPIQPTVSAANLSSR
jgi:hypothetical protein